MHGTEDPYRKKVEVESRALENIMGIEKKWQIIKIVARPINPTSEQSWIHHGMVSNKGLCRHLPEA